MFNSEDIVTNLCHIITYIVLILLNHIDFSVNLKEIKLMNDQIIIVVEVLMIFHAFTTFEAA